MFTKFFDYLEGGVMTEIGGAAVPVDRVPYNGSWLPRHPAGHPVVMGLTVVGYLALVGWLVWLMGVR